MIIKAAHLPVCVCLCVKAKRLIIIIFPIVAPFHKIKMHVQRFRLHIFRPIRDDRRLC